MRQINLAGNVCRRPVTISRAPSRSSTRLLRRRQGQRPSSLRSISKGLASRMTCSHNFADCVTVAGFQSPYQNGSSSSLSVPNLSYRKHQRTSPLLSSSRYLFNLDTHLWMHIFGYVTSFYRSSQLEALSSSAATGAFSVAPSSKFVLDRVGSAKARARKERLNGEHVLKRRISVSKHETSLPHQENPIT